MRKLDEAERKRRRALRYQKWKSKNSEHLKQYQAEHYLANRQKKISYRKIYYSTNKAICAARDRDYYMRNFVKKKESSSQTRQRAKEFMSAYKLEHGCIDCGFRGHAEALEFDHVRGVKEFGLSGETCIERIIKEIEKCEVRCANCHRIATVNRRKKSK